MGSPEDSRHDHRSSETSQTLTRIRDVSSIPDIPEELATELITIFFIKIQGWPRFLHEPKFFCQHMTSPGSTFAKKDEYSTLQMFQLYGIFELAAQLSNNPFFEDIVSSDRGAHFAALAEECYTTLPGSGTN
ncbi:hypothetical protein FMUND_6653 [Fusarium mundagurra]|uniref:Uncharacterized protein n=1 Tax=Fusarium mundagurra TaxID=1567541 RepID=A0A8H6DGE4_9HYPO|nr:hypothetical protein FMUND_6653 [Fusarium mundagurra]